MTARGERRAPSDWPRRRRATLYKVGGRGWPVSLRPVAAGLGGQRRSAPAACRKMATLKAVCVMKGDGPVEGVIHFQQQVGVGAGGGRERPCWAAVLSHGGGRAARPGPALPSSPHGRGGGLGVCGGVTVVTVSARGADPPSKVRLPAGGGAAPGLLVAVNRPEQPQK